MVAAASFSGAATVSAAETTAAFPPTISSAAKAVSPINLAENLMCLLPFAGAGGVIGPVCKDCTTGINAPVGNLPIHPRHPLRRGGRRGLFCLR